MLSVPDITPSRSWVLAWEGYFLDQRALGRSPKTISNRHSSVMLMAKWFTGQGTEPEQVARTDMKGYLVAQLEARQGAGAGTLYQDLKSFWQWYARDYEAPDPMAGVPRPKGQSRPVKVLRPDQLKAILDACKHENPWYTARDTAIVWLMLESGLRRAELVAVDIEDVDLVARTVAVRRGKGGRSRVAVFGDETATAIHRWLRRSKKTSGPLFVSCFGSRISLPGIRAILNRVGTEKAGVHLYPHMLRHAFAHYALESGAREGDLMEVAGWSTRAMLDRYGAELKRERALAAMSSHQVGKVLKGR